MVSQSKTKLYNVQSDWLQTYRHSIYLEKTLVEYSSFPFKSGDILIAKIDKDKLVIKAENTACFTIVKNELILNNR